nr:hypothetical protein [Mycolicibacterium komanii]CRL70338.1 hypothetical protein CPGR_01948 [Mycolicibacterium komanii]
MSLDPSVSLNVCENALRELIRHTFGEAWGVNWIERVTTPEQRSAWADRAAVDQAHTRKGVAQVPAQDHLDFSHFYELLGLADKHWDKLAAALGKKAITLALLKRFEDLRDRVAHGRTLLAFEQELMSGIAGQIRNQVTIYMSTQDPHGEYYPRIDSITDEFGHQILGGPPASADGELLAGYQTKTVLKPGQVVRFRCRGTDPQDRNLVWRLTAGHGQREEITAASADEVVLTWTVNESDVRASIPAEIYLTSDGKYHRCAGFDQRAFFMYSVAPPDN